MSIVFPILTLINQSIKGGISVIERAFSLLLPTFADSLLLALVGTIIIVFVGFVSAYYSVKSNKTTSFDWLLLFIFAIPSTIFGISLIKFYNQPALDIIYSSYVIILIAYVGKFSFISSKLIANAINQIPNTLDEAAQIHGVSSSVRLRKILLPLVLISLFAAFIISFIFSLGELGTTIMLYPPGIEIMPIKVFTLMANAPQSLVSSMSLIVLTLTLLIIIIFYMLMKPLLRNYNLAND
jgi:iron(III) transport system permease protein